MTKLLTDAPRTGLPHSLLRHPVSAFRNLLFAMALGAFFTAASLEADTILRYSLEGQGGTQPVTPPTEVAEGLSAEGIIRGAGIDPYDLGRGMSSDNWLTIPDGEDGRQMAIDEEEYYEFSFTVAPGYVASLDGLVHSLRRSAHNGPMYFEWQYSFDGFATPGHTIVPQGPIWDMLGWTESYFYYRGRGSGSGGIAENYNYMLGDVAGQGEGNEMPTFVLSGIEDLQNIPGGTKVTFRLYAWGNASTVATNTTALGRENANQIGGPLITGTVIVDPDLGDQLPLQIISEIEGPNPAPGLHTFQAGSVVHATAPEVVAESADIRNALLGWSGTGSVTAEGTGSETTFTLNEASTLVWRWRKEHRLSAAVNGSGTVEISTAERRPLLGWDFSGYRVPPADRVPPVEGELGPGELSNMNGVPTSTVAPDMLPSVLRRTPVYDEDTEEGLRPADLSAGGLSASMWRHTPNLASAIQRDKYFEFKVQPVPGESVALNSLYFNYRYTETGPHSIALLYSLDDFATYEIIESVRIQDQASGTVITDRTILFPPHPELQNVTGEITFRLYAWGGTGSGVGTIAFRNSLGAGFDDMVLYGGSSEVTEIESAGELWLEPTALFNIEAIPDAGSIFTGWSGDLHSNTANLRGMDMRQPLTAVANFAADSDADGLPDDWEIEYFGDLSRGPSDDDDGDGFTHLEEYRRGTDPAHADELFAAGEVPLSIWENAQRDPILAGGFIIRDFGSGFRGAWEGSNDSRSAQDPFHPDGVPVPVVNNVSFDGPTMVVRADSWEPGWDDAAVEIVFSAGDNDGNTFFFRYQDELNWYRVAIAGEVSNADTRPLQAISIQKRIDGVYSALVLPEGPFTDPADVQGYKRMRVRFTPRMDGGVPKIDVAVSGWEQTSGSWQTASFGHREFTIDDELGSGRAGFGTWAQGGFAENTDWNPVNAGTLFESFKVILDGTVVLDEDWSSAPEPDEFPVGWENPFDGHPELGGDWYVSAHGSIAEASNQGQATSGSSSSHAGDADGPTLLAPGAGLAGYLIEFGIHPFDHGANGIVFDYVDNNNYGRILFANTIPGFDGSIPSGVAVSRKQNGVWTDVLIGDTGFVYRPGQPFQVSLMRSGQRYVMTAFEVDNPGSHHRWEWTDSMAPSGGGRYGFTSWQSADAHFLSVEVYGVAGGVGGDLTVTAIEKVGETIVLTVDNPSGEPYNVERCFDLTDGSWETVDTDRTDTTWSGPIPAGAQRVFWRLTR